MRWLLLLAELFALIAGIRSQKIRRAYPLFLASIAFSMVLVASYAPQNSNWLMLWWVPLECGAVLLRLAACAEAISAQKVNGLLPACFIIALFDVSLCKVIHGSFLMNVVQARQLIQIFTECALIVAVLIPRPNGYRRGLHLIVISLVYFPGFIVSLVCFNGWSDKLWEGLFFWSWLWDALAYAIWGMLTVTDEVDQFPRSLFEP